MQLPAIIKCSYQLYMNKITINWCMKVHKDQPQELCWGSFLAKIVLIFILHVKASGSVVKFKERYV